MSGLWNSFLCMQCNNDNGSDYASEYRYEKAWGDVFQWGDAIGQGDVFQSKLLT